jgi:hypothetical protein
MRFPYRSKFNFAMWIVTLFMSVLIGVGIVLLLDRPTFGDGGAMYVASSASPIAAVVNSTGLVTALPEPLTPIQASAREANTPEQQVALPASSPQPRAPIAAPTQVANTTKDQQTTPETSARQTPTLTAPKPLPTTGPASAEMILLKVAEAEAALRTGQLEATITASSGLGSSALARFDLGDEQRVPRFHITTTYESTTGGQTTERITIGDQSWERQQNGRWTTMPARESALKQLQVFLPRTDSIANPKRVTVEGTYALHWYDAARDADVTLRVGTAGIPQQLRRVSRANGLVLTVTYSGWNMTVEITPPDTT